MATWQVFSDQICLASWCNSLQHFHPLAQHPPLLYPALQKFPWPVHRSVVWDLPEYLMRRKSFQQLDSERNRHCIRYGNLHVRMGVVFTKWQLFYDHFVSLGNVIKCTAYCIYSFCFPNILYLYFVTKTRCSVVLVAKAIGRLVFIWRIRHAIHRPTFRQNCSAKIYALRCR